MISPHSYQDHDLLSTHQAAAYLGLNPRTLQIWRTQGGSDLPWIQVGRKVKYRWGDIQEYLQAHQRHSAQQA